MASNMNSFRKYWSMPHKQHKAYVKGSLLMKDYSFTCSIYLVNQSLNKSYQNKSIKIESLLT